MRPEKQKRRFRLFSWRAIRTMYRKQYPEKSEEELERMARQVTPEINKLNYRSHYDQWRFEVHERTAGLRVIEPDDPDDLDRSE